MLWNFGHILFLHLSKYLIGIVITRALSRDVYERETQDIMAA